MLGSHLFATAVDPSHPNYSITNLPPPNTIKTSQFSHLYSQIHPLPNRHKADKTHLLWNDLKSSVWFPFQICLKCHPTRYVSIWSHMNYSGHHLHLEYHKHWFNFSQDPSWQWWIYHNEDQIHAVQLPYTHRYTQVFTLNDSWSHSLGVATFLSAMGAL